MWIKNLVGRASKAGWLRGPSLSSFLASYSHPFLVLCSLLVDIRYLKLFPFFGPHSRRSDSFQHLIAQLLFKLTLRADTIESRLSVSSFLFTGSNHPIYKSWSKAVPILKVHCDFYVVSKDYYRLCGHSLPLIPLNGKRNIIYHNKIKQQNYHYFFFIM